MVAEKKFNMQLKWTLKVQKPEENRDPSPPPGLVPGRVCSKPALAATAGKTALVPPSVPLVAPTPLLSGAWLPTHYPFPILPRVPVTPLMIASQALNIHGTWMSLKALYPCLPPSEDEACFALFGTWRSWRTERSNGLPRSANQAISRALIETESTTGHGLGLLDLCDTNLPWLVRVVGSQGMVFHASVQKHFKPIIHPQTHCFGHLGSEVN